jgi:hypothetical protein
VAPLAGDIVRDFGFDGNGPAEVLEVRLETDFGDGLSR